MAKQPQITLQNPSHNLILPLDKSQIHPIPYSRIKKNKVEKKSSNGCLLQIKYNSKYKSMNSALKKNLINRDFASLNEAKDNETSKHNTQ